MAKFITKSTPSESLGLPLLVAGLLVSLSCAAIQPASAQGLKHFYMARQQVQITDDAPLVNDQRTFPQGGQPQNGMGALPTRPVGLPRAGFQQYSSTMPGFNTSLPQVVNGVPPKEPLPAPVKQSHKAKADKLKATKSPTTTAKTTTPPVTAAKSYSPYKGYNPAVAPVEQTTASGGTNMQSKTRVRGSVLHWARGH